MTATESEQIAAASQGVMITGGALDVQIGGGHYKSCAIQPVQFIEANGLAFLEGCVIKRVTRHNRAGGKGLQDIDKAIHELQLIKQLRYGAAPPAANDNSPCCNGGHQSAGRCSGCLEAGTGG